MSPAKRQPTSESRGNRGFSLIELLIVVAVILIIASIAIPNMMRAKMAANQSAAVGDLRTIASAEGNFWSTYNDGYATTLLQLGGPVTATPTCAQANMIDEVLGAAVSQRSGYIFQLQPSGTVQLMTGIPVACGASGDTGFEVSAVPITVNTTGTASYCIDDSGVLRIDSTGAATANGVYPCPVAMT
ncbi:MAG TPA: prepilin-type N-terminal cleavage/methylation domain-containing protein, partial [Candidatus Acidoferrales bacterium]|nr:prepilin-type N-terminal cleavage/methylation domain-containing protein [Candidatus Acidoferrales bacterium]